MITVVEAATLAAPAELSPPPASGTVDQIVQAIKDSASDSSHPDLWDYSGTVRWIWGNRAPAVERVSGRSRLATGRQRGGHNEWLPADSSEDQSHLRRFCWRHGLYEVRNSATH